MTLLMITSCGKDEESEMKENDPVVNIYEELTYETIVNSSELLNSEDIEASNVNGYLLNICDVIIYKTKNQRYGKFKILNFEDEENKRLTIKAITYDNDGSIYNQIDSLKIRGTYTCDLDSMIEGGSQRDFHWKRINTTDTKLRPWGDSLFGIYK